MNVDGWDLFISYAREDQAWVKVLAENLHQLGFEVFFDEWEVGPGSVVAHALDEGLKRSRCGVVVVSPAALERPWVLEEYAAMVSATVSRGMQLIPVLYREAEMPAMLSTRRWVDFRQKVGKAYLQALDELAAGLRGGATAKRPPRGRGLRSPAPALVRGALASPIEVAEPVAVQTYRAWLAERAATVEMIGVAGGEMELDLEAIYVALRAAPQDRREAMPGSDGVRAPRQLRPGWAPHLPGDVRVDNAGATIQQQVIVQGHASFDAADDERAYEHACQEPETIDVETVFRGSPTRHALILGHPGSGKTTALRKILFSVRDDAAAMGLTAGTVPLWLPLRRFAGLAGRGIGEWIGEELAIADRDAPLDRELGPELWRHGRLLLLADGLDEVASETKRRDLCKYLDASLLLARDARAIVSCRYTGYRNEVRLPATFSSFELQPLDDRQVEELVTRWFEEAPKAMPTVSAGTSRERGAQLCEALRGPLFRHQRRGVMKSSPLLLTLMCVIENAGQRMPESRVEFYKRCLDVFLTRRGKKGAGELPIDLPGAVAVVQRLAYVLHSAGERDDLPRSSLTRAALEELQRSGRKPRLARAVILWLLEGTGILREFAAEHLGFFHLGMQEYLTAAYVAEVRGEALDTVVDALTDARAQERSWWHEVTRLMVALPSAGMFATLCERLLAQDRGWARHRELVHDWIEEAPAPSPAPFVAHLRGSCDVSEMIAGLGVLDRFAGDEAVRELATELSGAEDAHVQEMAQRLLTRHHEETQADSPAALTIPKGARPQPLALLFRGVQRDSAERLARALEGWCPLLRDDDGALVEAERLAEGTWFDRVADTTAGVIVLADGSGAAFEGSEGIEDALVIWAAEGRSLYGAWAGGPPPSWPPALTEAGAASWDDVIADGWAALGKRIVAHCEGASSTPRTAILKGAVFVEPVTGMRALAVPAGRYRMGMKGVSGAEPVRWVRMSAFWLGETPVTNLQYQRFLDANPGRELPSSWTDARFEGETRPVVGVNWDDAVAFCAWLSQLAPVRSAGLRVTLPSEAQWEFAARGEDGRRYPWGEAPPNDRLAVFGRRERGLTTAPVGSCPAGAGPFGHHDLAGNVWEWCRDVWNDEAYSLRGEDAEDPVNDVGDLDIRSARGSSWSESELRGAAERDGSVSRYSYDDVGFRVGFETASLDP